MAENKMEILEFFPTQKQAFSKGDANKHTFYYSVDTGDIKNKGSKCFGSCIDLNTFLSIYETVPSIERNFYELIRTDVPRCEYYDIDLYAEKNPLNKSAEQIFLEFKGIHDDFVKETFGYENRCEWYITDSSRLGEKVSIHLLNRNRVWKNSLETKQWYDKFEAYRIAHHGDKPDLFDTSVSSSNRNMRLIGSTKFGDTRTLECAKWHSTSSSTGDKTLFVIQNVNYETFVKTSREVDIYQKTQASVDSQLKSLEKNRITEEEKLVIAELADLTDDPIENLVGLIINMVVTGKHSLCQNNQPTLKYEMFRNLSFAYISARNNTLSTATVDSFWLTDMYPVYESAEKHREHISNIWQPMHNARGQSGGFTLASLHYWARENPVYKSLFLKPELKHKGIFNACDKSYFWGDFRGEMTGTVFLKLTDAQEFLVKNLNRVCTIVKGGAETFYLKISDDCLFVRENINCPIFYIKSKGKSQTSAEISFSKLYNMCVEQLTRYNDIVFTPYDVLTAPYSNPKIFNTYTGMKAQFVETPNVLTIQPILHHIKLVWCDMDELKYKIIMSWLHSIIKTPHKKTKKMIVLFSETQQIGKTLIAEYLVNQIFGRSISGKTTCMESIAGKFNAFRENKIFICLDEGPEQEAHNRGDWDKLKSVITDPIQIIERKGIDPRQVVDYTNLMVLSNHGNSVKVVKSDARTHVFKCNDTMAGNTQYFNDLVRVLENEDVADHFYSYLYNYCDDTSFHTIMETEERDEMIYATSEQPVKFLLDIKSGTYACKLDDAMTLEDMFALFNDWICKGGYKTGIYDISKFKMHAKKMLGNLDKRIYTDDKKRVRAWDATPLITAQTEAYAKWAIETE